MRVMYIIYLKKVKILLNDNDYRYIGCFNAFLNFMDSFFYYRYYVFNVSVKCFVMQRQLINVRRIIRTDDFT